MDSSSHSTLCLRPAIVASASFDVPSVVSVPIVEGATPHSSCDGKGRGVPGEE